MIIPSASEYVTALSGLKNSGKISKLQLDMLAAHYRHHNRTMTYTELANAGGEQYDSNAVANSQYGRLGAALGDALGFPFVDRDATSGTKFYSSAIGMGLPKEYSTRDEFELVMHHELAIALARLNWFPA